MKNATTYLVLVGILVFLSGCGLIQEPENEPLISKKAPETNNDPCTSSTCVDDPPDDPPKDPPDDPPDDPKDPPDDPPDDPPVDLKVKLRQDKQAVHRDLGYTGARRKLFGPIDAKDGLVECIYTGQKVKTNGQIPDHTIMNTEHVWPQSRGATGIAKSDLNHLLPTMSEANNRRSSHFFGNVQRSTWSEGGSSLGDDSSGKERFEPRDVSKGNIARAMFYFAIMYQKPIASDEEAVLRQWHKSDPVDATERARNDKVAQAQGSRNPFIDHPEFVDQITDF